jgi:hypothetical protein
MHGPLTKIASSQRPLLDVEKHLRTIATGNGGPFAANGHFSLFGATFSNPPFSKQSEHMRVHTDDGHQMVSGSTGH